LKRDGKTPIIYCTMSPPARGRGLKRYDRGRNRPYLPSPPARGRGLKPDMTLNIEQSLVSPPARGRGLKQVMPDGC